MHVTILVTFSLAWVHSGLACRTEPYTGPTRCILSRWVHTAVLGYIKMFWIYHNKFSSILGSLFLKRIFGLPPHASPESTLCKIRCRILVIGQRGGAQQKESQNRQPTVLTWAAPTLPKLVHMCNRCLKYTFRQGVNNKPESGSGLQYILNMIVFF